MNKKERVKNCIDNKPIDKTPCSFWHHYKENDTKGKQCVAKHKELYEKTNIDFIKMMCDGYFGETIPFDCKIVSPSDWDKIKIPSMDSSFVIEQLDRVKWMIDETKDECCVYYVLFSAFTYLMQYYGLDFCVEQLRNKDSNPYITRALKNMSEFVGELGKLIITNAGATGIHQAVGFNYLFSKDEYEKWMKPNDKFLINKFKEASNYNIIHLCGWEGFKNNIECWKDYDASVVHWDQHTDKLSIEEGKKFFTNAKCYMSGFDNKENSNIYSNDKTIIKEAAKKYARLGGNTGFILSADCSLESYISYESLRWVVEAMDELAEER